MSTTLTIPGVVLNLVSDPTTAVPLNSTERVKVDVRVSRQLLGSSYIMASGTVKATREPGQLVSVSVAVNYASRTQREAVEALAGELICYRDYKGRLFIGSFLELSENEQPGPDLCDFSFTVNEITYSIEV